jgi:hypothetical protein
MIELTDRGLQTMRPCKVSEEHPHAPPPRVWEKLDDYARLEIKPVPASGPIGACVPAEVEHSSLYDLFPVTMDLLRSGCILCEDQRLSTYLPEAPDEALFKVSSLPLPITHVDFPPGKVSLGEAAMRSVVEEIERTVVGVSGPALRSKVYGLMNFPARTTCRITSPEAPDWRPPILAAEIREMVAGLAERRFYGPYGLYYGPKWADAVLPDILHGIEGPVCTKAIKGYDILIVQRTTDVVRIVIGLKPTAVQWEAETGMMKVLAIMVPQLRADFYGKCGITHASPEETADDVPEGIAAVICSSGS